MSGQSHYQERSDWCQKGLQRETPEARVAFYGINDNCRYKVPKNFGIVLLVLGLS